MIVGKLFMAACMWLFLPIVYVSMKTNTVPKNNLILSVTLPPEARQDPEVLAYCAAYRKRLLRVCILLTAALLPALFLPRLSVSSLWSLVWLPIAMIVIMRNYGKGYQGLRAIKHRRGWVIPTAGQVVTDLRPMKLPKRLKTGWFVPPMILSVLPVLSCFLDDWGSSWNLLLAITAGSNLMVTAISLICYGLIFRQKKDLLDDDLELTEALTRLRRRNWTRMWLLTAWLSAGYSLAVWFCQGNMTAYTIWTAVYCILLTAAALVTEFAVRRAQQRLTQNRTRQPLVDEDDYWIWGQFYCNPHSTKFTINERVGMGMSINLAHPAGKAMMVFTVLVLLSLPVLGIWMVVEETTPVTAEITAQELIVRQNGTYTVALEDIESAALLEKLPPASRTWGTGLPNLLKGRFLVDGYGSCTLSLDPTNPPFLLLDTTEGTYIFGIDNTEEIYHRLQALSAGSEG